MDYKEHHKLNQEFIERFPLEKLKDMTIEQYTSLDTWGLSLCANIEKVWRFKKMFRIFTNE